MSNRAAELYRPIVKAYEAGDAARLEEEGNAFLTLIDDLDTLLATRSEFLLGRWLAGARRWARSDEKRRLFEWNARNQIALWGPPDSRLHDYAAKQWAGLLRGFYKPRWERFLTALKSSLNAETPWDAEALENGLQAWEDSWTHETGRYAAEPRGDAVATAQGLFEEYVDGSGAG